MNQMMMTMKKTPTKLCRVTRYCIVKVEIEEVSISSPLMGIVAIDEEIDYDALLRNITPEGVITNVEFTGEFDGADVEMIDLDTGRSSLYEFDEEDIEEITGRFRVL